MDLGKIIHEKALECGYDNCGVISLEAFGEYKERLKERIAKFPEAAAVLETPLTSLKLKENYPWAKSAIICTEYYGKYKILIYRMTFSNRNIPSGNCSSSSSAHISGLF